MDDALSAYDAEQLRRDQLKVVVQQDQVALGVAQQRYREGAIDFLNVLTVQRDLLNAESDLAQSEASAAVNLVILYKALGGGWSRRFLRLIRHPHCSRARKLRSLKAERFVCLDDLACNGLDLLALEHGL